MYKFKTMQAFWLSGLKFSFYNQKCLISRKMEQKAIVNINKALDYYDAVYPPVFGSRKWSQMKKALMEDAKYVAIVNNFSDTEEIVKHFEELGAYDVGVFYSKIAQNFDESLPDLNNTSNLNSQNNSQSKGIRPSLIKLTHDEKAEAAKRDEIERYPEEYKKRASDKLGGLNEFNSDTSRLIKSSKMTNSAASFTFDHIPSTKLKGCEDWMEESDVFKDVGKSDEEIEVKRITEDKPITWPKNLKVYSFVKGDNEGIFPSPLPSKTISTFTHYLLNGASILPVLALDIQSGDAVLDMCASPGGKSLSILQTFLPSLVVCNDVSRNRVFRIQNVFDQYLPRNLSSVWDTVNITMNFGENVTNPESFDKVLVDAPCLNDRLSLQKNDNSIFKSSRVTERLKMPELQAELIVAALKSLKPGGCMVYSTCTLSPMQNDGAVHLALTKIWRETKIDCTVVNMNQTMKNINFMYAIGHNLKLRYGHIVLPLIDNNCGPMYVCKIIKDR